jgi:hypothetical protein
MEMNCSPSGIYLIRFAIPHEEQWGFPWGLITLKTANPREPYFAFDSDTAAAEYIARRGDSRLSFIEASQLDLSFYYDHTIGARVFKSLAEMDVWLADPSSRGGHLKPLPAAGLLSEFVRVLKNWRGGLVVGFKQLSKKF